MPVNINIGDRVFAPRLVPTIATIAMLAVTLSLGFWQVYRAEWKGQLIAEWQAQIEKPPIDLLPPADKAETVKFAHARLIGKYLNDKSVQLVPRAYEGKTGYELITPLRMMTGETVLVDRGFVADDTHDAVDLPIGTIFSEGELRPLPGRGWMQPDNHPATNEWYWLDAAAVAKAHQLDTPYPLMLIAQGKPVRSHWPVPHSLEQPYANNHLTYAFIWFSLSLSLIVIYTLSQMKKD